MLQPNRTYSASANYRYGFNGKENDNEVKGTGNQEDYGARMYDPRVGRFLSVDPLAGKFAFLSTYQFAGNSPIRALDKDGEEPKDYSKNWKVNGETFIGVWGQNVRTVYDEWTKKSWSVMNYPNNGDVYYWKPYDGTNGTFDFEHSGASNKDPKGNWTGAWQRFETQEAKQARYASDLVDKMSVGFFGIAAIGTAAPLAAIVAPSAVSLATTYGTEAWAATTTSRLLSAGTDAAFQYIQNAPEFGYGADNLRNINLTSVGLSAINPASISVNAVVGNFGKTSVENKFSAVVGGSKFSLKNAVLATGVDYTGGLFGDLMGKSVKKYLGMTDVQSSVIDNITEKAVTTPANIIASESSKEKTP